MASPYEILKLDNIRLRSMIDYAMDAPDYASCKSILADALDGVNGAENYEEVKGEREALRARIEVLEKVAEAVVAGCPCCDGKGFTVSVSLATVDDPEQEQCQFCYYARAALDAAKEGK